MALNVLILFQAISKAISKAISMTDTSFTAPCVKQASDNICYLQTLMS
jgi:hypothetical protein